MTQPLRVNFSSDEASSKPREVPPSGEYLVNIVDGSLETVQPNRKNTGKPYWKLRFVIQEGPYAGTTLTGTVMLFDGALFSLSQLMTALGYDVQTGNFQVPQLDKILGTTINVKGYKRPPSTSQDGKEVGERFEIKSYKRANASVRQAEDSSLLP